MGDVDKNLGGKRKNRSPPTDTCKQATEKKVKSNNFECIITFSEDEELCEDRIRTPSGTTVISESVQDRISKFKMGKDKEVPGSEQSSVKVQIGHGLNAEDEITEPVKHVAGDEHDNIKVPPLDQRQRKRSTVNNKIKPTDSAKSASNTSKDNLKQSKINFVKVTKADGSVDSCDQSNDESTENFFTPRVV